MKPPRFVEELWNDAEIPPVDLHMHTNWTDGENSSIEMYDQAVLTGMIAIAFSEHARGSSGGWFPKFADEIRSLPASPCRAYVGVEVKILDKSGALDATDNILACCDQVMASVHRFPGETDSDAGTKNRSAALAIDMEFELMCAALRNSPIDVLGHPFGMSYRRFGVAPPDDLIKEVIELAAETDIAFEINARYHPKPSKFLEWCLSAGARVSFGSNAHSTAEVGKIHRIMTGAENPWQL